MESCKFKKGDKVRVVEPVIIIEDFKWQVGTIATEPECHGLDDEHTFEIDFDGCYQTAYDKTDVLELVEKPKDNVNHPSHYGNGSIECIDYLEDFLTEEEFIGYLRGNIGKYLHRWRYKNGLEDLRKAEWYLKKLIGVVEHD